MSDNVEEIILNADFVINYYNFIFEHHLTHQRYLISNTQHFQNSVYWSFFIK